MCPSLLEPDNHQNWVANIYLFFRIAKDLSIFACWYNINVMDLFFDFNNPASGKNFIARKTDVNYLSNMIVAGESIALYGEPHIGRKSLVRQALTFAQMSGKGVSVVNVDLLSKRTNEAVLSCFITELFKLCAPSLEEALDVFNTYLEDAPLVFDRESFTCDAPYVTFTENSDEDLCRKILGLAYDLAERQNLRLCIIFHHFQNANEDANAHILFKAFESLVASRHGRCCMIFMGDRMNAMKEIFEVKRYFWKDVVIYPISDISEIEAGEYVLKGFQYKGKVVERNLIQGVARALRCNMWYVNNFFAIMDYLSIGYGTERTRDDSWGLLMAQHRGRFVAQMADLTDFQIQLLKAVIDGETRLSSTPVVEKYKLNSSANVKRLKDALMKKEVLWFDEKDVPHIQDVLFEHWLKQEYFV